MKLPFTQSRLHELIYVFALSLLAAFIPLNRYLLIIPVSLLALNWIIEGKYRQKIIIIHNNPYMLLFISVFFVYVIGSILSENRAMGLEKLGYMITLLVVPVVMTTSVNISRPFTHFLLLFYSISVIGAAIACLLVFAFNGIPDYESFRSISAIKPHIRFSFEIIMAVFILLYFAFYRKPELSVLTLFRHYRFKHEKPLLLVSALFLLCFMVFLQSLSGLIIFTLLVVAVILKLVFSSGNKMLKVVSPIILLLIVFFISWYTYSLWMNNFKGYPIQKGSLEKYTVNGNPYRHDTTLQLMENGFYTEIYLCESELNKEWNSISSFPYEGKDLKGQEIRSTLKRFLTSKGLRKDSVSLHALTPADIDHIQKGLANYRFKNHPDLNQRFYETLWEIHVYKRINFAGEHSFMQRLVFVNIALKNILEHPAGTGTGDVQDEMKARAKSEEVSLSPNWSGMPHNQYLFFTLAFGFTGFAWIMFAFVYPVFKNRSYKQFLFNIFASIMLISMFTIDTIESYDSIAFFVFFYTLFVLIAHNQQTKAQKKQHQKDAV
jgi:hypothetical protein